MHYVRELLGVCRARVHRHATAWAGRLHLVYFAAVAVEGHGVYGWAAMICLALGLAAESTGGGHVG